MGSGEGTRLDLEAGIPPGASRDLVPVPEGESLRQGARTPRVILCPRCSLGLIESEVRSHYGARLTVEHCLNCGGQWTTWGKLVALSIECAAELKAPESAPPPLVPAPARIQCPHCSILLDSVPSTDFPTQVRAPQDLIVYLCPDGHGIWLDGGEFERFKVFQAESLEKRRQKYREERASRTRLLGERALGPDRTVRYGTGMLWMAFASLVLTAIFCLLWLLLGPSFFPWFFH
jgi:Zn-finger nucleic acid-binding protein